MNHPITVERATSHDVPAVAQIHVDAWRAAYAGLLSAEALALGSLAQREAQWTQAVATGRPELLVARQLGTVVGWVALGACRDADAPPSQGEIWALYVAPGHWSQGVGRSLWRAARDALRGQGYQCCSLWVLADNEAAIGFYRAIGFTSDGLPRQPFELAGQLLHEVRYLCPLDA